MAEEWMDGGEWRDFGESDYALNRFNKNIISKASEEHSVSY